MISAGSRHTCAITVVREAFCWGSNETGQVGDFAFTGPTLTKVPGSLGWTQISAGATHTCAVRTDGALFCWGANDRGQLGNGGFAGNTGLSRVPSLRPSHTSARANSIPCARTTVGAVFCWGAVWTGRENGLEISRSQPTPQPVPGAPALASLSVGAFATCGADASGFAYCWEANPRGQMGNGTEEGSLTPQRVATDLEFVQVSAGIVQTCGVVTSGAGYCWGDDTFGQLGISPSLLIDQCGSQRLPCSKVPVAVVGRQLFTEISTGPGKSFVRSDDARQSLLLGPRSLWSARRRNRGVCDLGSDSGKGPVIERRCHTDASVASGGSAFRSQYSNRRTCFSSAVI
jgi:alpha-tubulin suppressor-like RCC1 family protein